eukprot:6484043-Ditylum_brightwellii.AAC.1
MVSLLGLTGETRVARQIVDGTLSADNPLDEYTKGIIRVLSIPETIQAAGPIVTSLATEDFQQHWDKAKEQTSSLISGLHFEYYKSVAQDITLSSIHALKAHLAKNGGIILYQWAKGLQAMLFKEDGNIDIACLCAILLLEADYNWILKELINRQLLQHAFCLGAIPKENFGSVQDGMSSALVHWGMPQHVIVLLISILRGMSFYISTGHGDSTNCYGGTWDDLFQTLCQGSGSAPGLWLSTSSALVTFLHDRGHATEVVATLSGICLFLVALIFVDDTNLLQHTTTTNSDALWNMSLQAIGGALKPSKSFFQLIGFTWRDSNWQYQHLPNPPSLPIIG